jgi:hypothetical protein
MTAVLVGYFAKRTQRHPEWPKAPQVEEIASVSDCLSKSPPDWIDYWRHNDLGS